MHVCTAVCTCVTRGDELSPHSASLVPLHPSLVPLHPYCFFFFFLFGLEGEGTGMDGDRWQGVARESYGTSRGVYACMYSCVHVCNSRW